MFPLRLTSSGLDAWYVTILSSLPSLTSASLSSLVTLSIRSLVAWSPLISSLTGVTLWHNASAFTASCTRVTTVRRTCQEFRITPKPVRKAIKKEKAGEGVGRCLRKACAIRQGSNTQCNYITNQPYKICKIYLQERPTRNRNQTCQGSVIERFSFECRNVIGFALCTRCDWLKRFAPPFHPIRSKTKANCDALACIFPRFASATCNYFEFWLVQCIVCVLCDWPE